LKWFGHLEKMEMAEFQEWYWNRMPRTGGEREIKGAVDG
jgi:hypothetical protein